MNILYDYQIFEEQISGGISKYHANLYLGMKDVNMNPYIGIKYSNNIFLKELGIKQILPYNDNDIIFNGISFRGRRKIKELAKRMYVPFTNSHDFNAKICRNLILSGKIDILHPTYYNDTYNDIKKLPPVVVTIHDMIYESYPQYFNNLDIINCKEKWLKRANKVITISEFSKNELLKYYSFLNEEDIHVIYHGININENRNNYITKDNYILFVGERGGYKDFYTVLRAIKILKKKNRDILLLCIGREFNKNEVSYIDFLELNNNVKNTGRISDTELSILYKKAQIYISSSISEGFGLPLLEAMNNSTPMILSNIPVYKEIAHDAAIYFQCMNEYELAEKIDYVYNNDDVQRKLVKEGQKRILKFNHKDTINNTLKIYNSLL